MNQNLNAVVWNIRTEKELRDVGNRLAEYSIPFAIGKAGSSVPGHAPILTDFAHLRRAIKVVEYGFGRRNGGID